MSDERLREAPMSAIAPAGGSGRRSKVVDHAHERRREGPAGPTAAALVGLLATPARLRVVAAVVLGAATPAVIVQQTGLTEAEVAAALTRLVRGGLVQTTGGGFAVDPATFTEAARAAAAPRPQVDFGVSDPKIAAVLRAFLVDGRLNAMPATAGKRQIVLEYLAGTFEPGRRYTEPEVNAALVRFHADTAMLRRYLVDAGLMSRAGGLYWRTGGWVDVLS